MVDPLYIKSKIDHVRDLIGREVTFYTSTKSMCPLCVASGYFDPLTDTTYYFTCSVCTGDGWVESVTETQVNARVHWAGAERITATPGGKFFVGDCTLGIDPSYHSLAQQAQKDSGKVVVDGYDMQILRIDPMGAPTINRYKLICKSMGNTPPSD